MYDEKLYPSEVSIIEVVKKATKSIMDGIISRVECENDTNNKFINPFEGFNINFLTCKTLRNVHSNYMTNGDLYVLACAVAQYFKDYKLPEGYIPNWPLGESPFEVLDDGRYFDIRLKPGLGDYKMVVANYVYRNLGYDIEEKFNNESICDYITRNKKENN